MARKFVPFEDIEQLATIEQLAQMLRLKTSHSGVQLRCSCPVHGGDERTIAISPNVRSRRGSLGVFYCQKGQSGGDRIGLVAHCMELGQQDAAFFIAEQFGAEVGTETGTSEGTGTGTVKSNSRATVPQKREERTVSAQPAPTFDPQAFSAKLTFTDEVAALGFSEEDAERFSVGVYRGKLYIPLRHANGSIACFMDYAGGTLKAPARNRWLEPSNVVPLVRKSA